VRSRRLELPRAFAHNDLNVARLPIPPRPHVDRVRLAAPRGRSAPLAKRYRRCKRWLAQTFRRRPVPPWNGAEWAVAAMVKAASTMIHGTDRRHPAVASRSHPGATAATAARRAGHGHGAGGNPGRGARRAGAVRRQPAPACPPRRRCRDDDIRIGAAPCGKVSRASSRFPQTWQSAERRSPLR
jgi:hypothetical protein